MSQQTHNAFADAYQMSKISWSMDDNGNDKILSATLPPVSHKKEKKTIVRPMRQDEIDLLNQQCESLNIKL